MKKISFESSLSDIFRLTDNQKKGLKKLKIETVNDLLYYFPVRYGDFNELSYIKDLKVGAKPIIHAEVKSINARKAYNSKMTMTEAVLEEVSGDKIKAIWFSQPYISKMLTVGQSAKFMGTVSERSGSKYLSNPEFEKIDSIPIEKSGALFEEESSEKELMLFPVYKETKYITSKWIYHKIQKIFTSDFYAKISDPIPDYILDKYKLPDVKSSLIYMHSPRKIIDTEAAKKRFAFEEIFFVNLIKQNQKKQYEETGAFVVRPNEEKMERFKESFGFELTDGQKESIESILDDMGSEKPMSRLLEGDVGSGKTVVAATTAYAAIITKPKNQNFGGLQVAYMAPTEILAKQIFSDFCEFFGDKGINVGLLTSKDCRKFPSKIKKNGQFEATKISKAQLLKWTLNGEVQVVVGTHALISKNVFFENLGLVVIDEQHRFGKNQRAKLRNKPQEKLSEKKAGNEKLKTSPEERVKKKGLTKNEEILPHLLSMTATPIPRTLALTIYGDLDLTVLDQMPSGRKKIKTELATEKDRDEVYEKVKKELEDGRQAYVICSRIFEPDPDKERQLNVKSAVGEAERLATGVFKDYKIGVLHSKLKKDEKDKVMDDFSNHKYDILVSTSVVEVGVNVPNATSMIIESGHRFGLSQLHQLRGRVRRSTHQPYCYIFADIKTEITEKRLSAITTAKNGFELAEYDLQFRGAGQMIGNAQWGVSDIAMEALKNLKLIEIAKKEAHALIFRNELYKYPETEKKFKVAEEKLYLE